MRKKQILQLIPVKLYAAVVLSVLLLAWGCGQQNIESQKQDANLTENADESVLYANSDIIVDDPVGYMGLEIFPIRLKNGEINRNYVTLAEAISSKDIIVDETSNVNQLTVSNTSDKYIYILAGDIIKGGKQDRTIGVDVILPPGSEKIPIESYCVESGRWQQRGTENARAFSENTRVLSSRELKLASKYSKNQSGVWQNVAEQQEKLNKNVSEIKGEQIDVRSNVSQSSLQLTLENKDLKEIIEEYKVNLGQLFASVNKPAGYAYAINGELYGIDVFNDAELFSRLSDKLYESAIIESISEYVPDSENESKKLNKNAVYELYKSQFDDEAKKTEVNGITEMVTYDKKDVVLFETNNSESKVWIHKNYIPKKESDKENELLNKIN